VTSIMIKMYCKKKAPRYPILMGVLEHGGEKKEHVQGGVSEDPEKGTVRSD